MNKPIRVAVTGAAGQISYSLLFRIAAGEMLGKDQPIILSALEITPAMKALEGVAMELNDCAFPLLHELHITDDAEQAFKDCDIALLVGARPRGAGMERKDLLEANAAIFSAQGKALNASASKQVKVLVVGNPANTNALIARSNAPDLNPKNFTAMTRLDHNRTQSLIALHNNVDITDVQKVIVWGNHSATQYPDLHHANVKKQAAMQTIEAKEYQETFIPTVQQRGSAIIKARGASSAASAANAAIDHIRDWVGGTAENDWTSMGVLSDGSYDIPEGLVYSFPVTCKDGEWTIVQGLDINELSRERMNATAQELQEERDGVKHLLP